MRHRMMSIIEIDPDSARKEIVAAFVKAQCHYKETAEILGCKSHTVTRWARALGIKDELAKIEARAEKEGWHHGKKGGAGYHRDPELRVKRALRTRKKRKKAAAAAES